MEMMGGGGNERVAEEGGCWQGSSLFMEQKEKESGWQRGEMVPGFGPGVCLRPFQRPNGPGAGGPEQQQDVLPFARGLAWAFGTPGVTPGWGAAAAPLTRTQNSFRFQSRGHGGCLCHESFSQRSGQIS